MKWEKGDIAICVKVDKLDGQKGNSLPPLRKGAEYAVNSVRTCECGGVSLDVGISHNGGINCLCGAVSSPTSGIWWCNAVRFVKKKVEHKEDSLINHIIESETV